MGEVKADLSVSCSALYVMNSVRSSPMHIRPTHTQKRTEGKTSSDRVASLSIAVFDSLQGLGGNASSGISLFCSSIVDKRIEDSSLTFAIALRVPHRQSLPRQPG